MEMKFILLFTIIMIICFLMIPFRVNYTKHTKNQSDLILTEYEQYLRDFNKSYGESSHEFTERERIFKNSKDLIERMNSYRQSNESASYGLTPYSDLTQEEFLQHQLKKNPLYQSNDKLNELIGDHKPEMDLQINDKDLVAQLQKMSTEGHPIIPLRLNWSELGKASPVLSQGKCGACWAISVLGAIQSLIAIQTETDSVEELSVQELIDCAGNRNKGCKGGDICSLLDWLVDNKIPLATNKEYPAKEYGDPVQSCQMDKILKSQAVNHKMPIIVNSTCTNFVNRESLILYYLAHYGPVAAAVNALSWQNYLGGIVQYHCDGNPIYLNHAVQIIGYDISGTIPYYIVRNSWGIEFGHNGDLKIAFGKNMCGIANQITIIDVSFV